MATMADFNNSVTGSDRKRIVVGDRVQHTNPELDSRVVIATDRMTNKLKLSFGEGHESNWLEAAMYYKIE